jgi:hypothetical protein
VDSTGYSVHGLVLSWKRGSSASFPKAPFDGVKVRQCEGVTEQSFVTSRELLAVPVKSSRDFPVLFPRGRR